MNKYDKKITFFIPGAFTQPIVLLDYFMDLYTNNNKVFKENVKIGCIYGCPKCIWNGGHYSGVSYSVSGLEQWKQFSQKWNIPIRFTFTNCLLETQHLNDSYGNLLLDKFNTGENEIICVSNELENYIRNNYGNSYKFISSTSKSLVNKDAQLEELNKDYYLVVLDIDHNSDIEFLRQIKNKDKVELLCNSTCQDNCPRKKAHYKYISQMQLNYGRGEFDPDPFKDCPYQYSLLYERKLTHRNFIKPEDINDIYIPLGFNNFKLEGRVTALPEWIETIIYFLIKDEFAMQVRQEMFKLVW